MQYELIFVIIFEGGDDMKKCLIVVDYQNDFIDGALGFEGGLAIKKKIVEKISEYGQQGYDLIFTKDTHTESYLETEEGKNLPVNHCIKGTKGHDFPDEIKALIKTYESQVLVIEKPTFPSIDLGVHLTKKDYQQVELCGLVSNICVLSNAVIAKGALPNAHIVVDALATASFDTSLHKQSLNVMKGLHIEVKNDV